MRLSIRSALITAAAVCAVSTSAFAGSHASCPVQGGTLKYGVKAEPPSYDMHATNSYAVMHFVAQHYSTLLTFDWENFPKLEGDLQKVGQCLKTVSYTFKLHKMLNFTMEHPLHLKM